MRKSVRMILAIAALWSGWNGFAQAESMRTLIARENRQPDLHRVEVGVLGQYRETPEDWMVAGQDEYIAEPYLRFGLVENLTVYGTLPYHAIDYPYASGEDGLGEARVGVELLAYEDIFGFPYVLPYVEANLDAADEELRTDQDVVAVGTAIGTTTYEVYHWVLDLRYTVVDEGDNFWKAAGAFIWELSDSFSVLLEGYVAEDSRPDYDDEDEEIATFLQAGMYYLATDKLSLGLYAGQGDHMAEETVVSGKLAYSF